MFEGLEKEWRRFADAAPGERFLAYHEHGKEQRGVGAVLRMGLGVVLALAGVVMLFVPGPGVLFIFFGLALVAARSATLARALDKAELGLRRALRWVARQWREVPRPVLAGVVLLAAGGAVGLGRALWVWLA